MKYLLDTNICIYIINRRPFHVAERFERLRLTDMVLSHITQYELLFGAYHSDRQETNKQSVDRFCTLVQCLPFEHQAADWAARIRCDLQKRGLMISAPDLFIAATALAHDLTLVTNNIKEFERIPHLKVENWL